MKVAVILRQVPDVVEELVIADDGRTLSEEDVMYITNEGDEHALEEALLLKARHAAPVTAFGVGGEEAKDALATAVAKGADEAVFVRSTPDARGDNASLAARLAGPLKTGGYGLVLTGVHAADQLDAGLGGLLAVQLAAPYVGGLTAVHVDVAGAKAVVQKEYAGGRLGVMEVDLPAVLGVQSAEQPPRYVSVGKVTQARRTLQASELSVPSMTVPGVRARALLRPESGAHAKMLEGDADHVAAEIVALVKERGLL